jgi:hypothetical protein
MLTEMLITALQGQQDYEPRETTVITEGPRRETTQFFLESSSSLADMPDSIYARLADRLHEAGYVGAEESAKFLQEILDA